MNSVFRKTYYEVLECTPANGHPCLFTSPGSALGWNYHCRVSIPIGFDNFWVSILYRIRPKDTGWHLRRRFSSTLDSDSQRCCVCACVCVCVKLLQLCSTLCNSMEWNLPGSSVPGSLQARILEWVTISFSNAWKWKAKVKLLSRVQLLVTPWTVAYQVPPSMGFSRQEYQSGLPLPSPDRDARCHNHLLCKLVAPR